MTVQHVDNQLQELEARYAELDRLLADPEIATDPVKLAEYGKERAELEPVVTTYRALERTADEITEHQELIHGDDPELAELAEEELAGLQGERERLEGELRALLVPKDPNDEKNVIVEIRAGAGGDEAALFAADLFRMYAQYADRKRWKIDVISSSEIGIGGFKEIIFEVRGHGAYSELKYESGVHRVQRIP
ncbi:MAG TPA: PCRF domain-containing protein, partial [Thermomicrobiaceae bacterium]|nr:PCRF domain-containing protein [Thermomicrobiaceae bacterium]